MKISVVVDVPEEGIIESLTPFEAEVKLDYGNKILYLNGKVEKLNGRNSSFVYKKGYANG